MAVQNGYALPALGEAGIIKNPIKGFETLLGFVLLQPTMSGSSPAEDTDPGDAGAFSANFRVARLTPIEFDLQGITVGANVSVLVSYEDRNESYVAFDLGGARRWPFDVQADNVVTVTGDGARHVRLLPRGGWPPTVISVQAGAGQKAP